MSETLEDEQSYVGRMRRRLRSFTASG